MTTETEDPRAELAALRAEVERAHTLAASNVGATCRAHDGDHKTMIRCILGWLEAARGDAREATRDE